MKKQQKKFTIAKKWGKKVAKQQIQGGCDTCTGCSKYPCMTQDYGCDVKL